MMTFYEIEKIFSLRFEKWAWFSSFYFIVGHILYRSYFWPIFDILPPTVHISITYRTRAINRRGFYSKIIILGFRLSHKNHVKNTF